MKINKISKLNVLIAGTGIILLITLIIVFVPVILFIESEEKESGEIVNLEDFQVLSYNPLNPKTRQYIKLDDPSYWVIEQEYQRVSLFEFKVIEDKQDLHRVDGVNIKEAKDNFENLDLDSDNVSMADLSEEMGLPECQSLSDMDVNGVLVSDFQGIEKNMNYIQFGDFFKKNISISGLVYNKDDNYITEFEIDDINNSEIIKIRLLWSFDPVIVNFDREGLKNNLLGKVELVDRNCNIFNIEVDSNNNFDFTNYLDS